MTGTRDPQQDGSIHAMLSDSGLESAAELRSALERLRTVVPDAAPAPRADLAALLAAGATGPTAPVSATTTALPVIASTTTALPVVSATTTALPVVASTTTALPVVASTEAAADESLPAGVTSLAERRGQKRRLAIVGGAVVGAMTLGAGAVAASSEDFRHSVSQSVGVIFQPPGNGTPASEHVQPSPSAVPALPEPHGTSRPGTRGAASSAPSSARTRAAKDGDEDSGRQSGRGPRTTPPAFGRDGILPSPGQRPGLPAPGLPGNGNGNGNGNEDMPHGPGQILPTLPGVVPTTAPGNP
jgi:hypothetical protein